MLLGRHSASRACSRWHTKCSQVCPLHNRTEIDPKTHPLTLSPFLALELALDHFLCGSCGLPWRNLAVSASRMDSIIPDVGTSSPKCRGFRMTETCW